MPSNQPSPATPPASIAGLSPTDKLLLAAQLALPKLPAGMRAEFATLFEPKALAATTALLAVWAASHATPLGWIVDLGILLLGVVALGGLAFVALEHLRQYVELARNARDQRQLEAAAEQLALAVVLIGAQAFVALVTKRAASGVRAATPAARAARLERLLLRLPGSVRTPQGRRGVTVALEFMAREFPDWDDAKLLSHLKCIDFSRPVTLREFTPGPRAQLIAYRDVAIEARWNGVTKDFEHIPRAQGAYDGNYFTVPGESVSRLGVAGGDRRHVRFRVTTNFKALESTAAPAADSWTAGRTPTFKHSKPGELGRELVSGGAKQFLISNPRSKVRVMP